MRVLHVVTGLGTGGAERMLQRLLATVSAKHGHGVVCLRRPGPVGHEIEALGIPVMSLGMRPTWPSYHALRVLREHVRGTRPEIIHGWMYHGCLAATLAAQRLPVVWGIRHSLDRLRAEPFGTRLVIRALSCLSERPDAIVYCSEASVRQHEEVGFRGEARFVIPNGFDSSIFRPDPAARAAVRTRLELSDQNFVIGHLARFHPMKDHFNLLRAAGLLVRRLPNVRFLLAGRGVNVSNERLTRLIRREHLTEHVLLLGERKDVPRLLNAFDVLVSSSAWGEAFPLVLGEAMASGVPCISTDVGDSARIIGTHGRVVPPRDPPALATALIAMLRMDSGRRRCLGLEARRRIVNVFPLKRVAGEYEALYGRVAGAAA